MVYIIFIFILKKTGALMTIPFMSKRIVKPTLKDLEVLLLCNDADMPPEHSQLAEDTRAQINAMETGSVGLGKKQVHNALELEKNCNFKSAKRQ